VETGQFTKSTLPHFECSILLARTQKTIVRGPFRVRFSTPSTRGIPPLANLGNPNLFPKVGRVFTTWFTTTTTFHDSLKGITPYPATEPLLRLPRTSTSPTRLHVAASAPQHCPSLSLYNFIYLSFTLIKILILNITILQFKSSGTFLWSPQGLAGHWLP
jgi:hypothetical protein